MKTMESIDQIMRYLDGNMPELEKKNFEEALRSNPHLKQQLEQFRLMEMSLKTEALDQPSKNFTQQVMHHLAHAPVAAKRPFMSGLLILGGIIIMAGICLFLSNAGAFDASNTTVNLDQINALKNFINISLPSVALNSKLMVNTIIFLNLVLALVVFDRVILRTLFQRKMRQG